MKLYKRNKSLMKLKILQQSDDNAQMIFGDEMNDGLKGPRQWIINFYHRLINGKIAVRGGLITHKF